MTQQITMEENATRELYSLHSKGNFDRIPPINGKATVSTVAPIKITDSAESDDGYLVSSILSESPNLYKQKSDSVSKIPYFFETPIPTYFRENKLFENENTWKFISWAFSKCCSYPRQEKYQGYILNLEPYEFICGREESSKECFLTPKIWRGQLTGQLNSGILKKTANSRANQFSCYVFVIEMFAKTNENQRANPRANPPQKKGPTKGPLSREIKNLDIDHLSREVVDEDFFKDEIQEEKILVYEAKKFDGKGFSLIDVFLTKKELEECIKVHGDVSRVLLSIHQMQTWKGRKYKIVEWSLPIQNWKIKNEVIDRGKDHEKIGKELEKEYQSSEKICGWSIRVYHDTKKDQKGMLFEGRGPQCEPMFISFSDLEFKEKFDKICIENRIKKIT